MSYFLLKISYEQYKWFVVNDWSIFFITGNPNITQEACDNYYRLVAFIIDIAVNVLHNYLTVCILKGSSLQDYLLKNIHTFVHLQYGLDKTCCKLPYMGNKKKKEYQKRYLNFEEFNKLFTEDPKIPCILRSDKHHCCLSFAPENIDVNSLDISLMCSIMNTCVDWTNIEHDKAQIDDIKKVRNTIFHSSDSKSIDQNEFESQWNKLSYQVKYLAKTISSDEEKHVEKQISEIKKMVRISIDDLKIKQLCLDYWKDKCSEFEVSCLFFLHNVWPNAKQ